jgi:phosphoglycolate phosphatase-like HAD superfamily hydrolase
MCEYKKPDGRVFEPLMNKFQIAPKELLYIGDENKDFRAALDAAHISSVSQLACHQQKNLVLLAHVS